MTFENYLQTPLAALKGQSRSVISRLLNATKVIPSPSGLPRDWRGLADIVGCGTSAHIGSADPTASVIANWLRSQPTIGQLTEALKQLDRWDIIDDTVLLFESDAKEYAERLEGAENHQLVREDSIDNYILTVDDVNCIESCGKPQYYEAFLLYDDYDEEFAMTTLDKLENEYKMKLCTKDRDLIGGLSFEHEAIMQLIKHRCGRLIVIVSPQFLNSPANQFLLMFAQAIGIEQRQRKIIPCVYTNFQLPLHLRYYFILNFSRSARQCNYWHQLSNSIKATNARTVTGGQVSEARAICYTNPSVESAGSPKVTEVKDTAEKAVEERLRVESKEEEAYSVQSTNTKASYLSSTSSFFSKVFMSHTSVAKSLLKKNKKKKKKLVKVLAE